jgi:hypothetical protein
MGIRILVVLCVASTFECPVKAQPASFKCENYLLKRPNGLSRVLGKYERRGECVDSDGVQLEYEHGYACTQNGVVTLVSYDLPSRPATPEEALAQIGIIPKRKPRTVQFGPATSYLWLQTEGNGLRVAGRNATRVMVTIGPAASFVMVNVGNE